MTDPSRPTTGSSEAGAPATRTMRLRASPEEVAAYQTLERLWREGHLPEGQLLAQLPLFMPRPVLAHTLFMSELYKDILTVHGDILEFGCRWGRNLALFIELRNSLEPHNHSRRIVGFDTFEGFQALTPSDGSDPILTEGALATARDWETTLETLLAAHRQLGPRPGLPGFQLVKGDVTETAPRWIQDNPGRTVAMAYFDMDIYKPTEVAIRAVLPRMPKGGILAFDEVNVDEFPGETIALLSALNLRDHRLVRSPISGNQSYVVLG